MTRPTAPGGAFGDYPLPDTPTLEEYIEGLTDAALAGKADNGPTANTQAKYVNAGRMSEDENGNYVQDGGGLFLGGQQGVWLRQEGFATHNEQGSWAAYPLVANRWCGLSIAPSGDPWNLPSENITSVAMQLRNGSSEERLTISAKWFGNEATGVGEYRIAPYASGIGRFWPLTLSNSNKIYAIFGALSGGTVSDLVKFTNAKFDGTSGGNTVVQFENPGTPSSIRAIVRTTDGVAGLERLTSGTAKYELRLLDGRIETNAPELRLTHTQPTLWFNESDQAANAKNWFVDAAGGQFRIISTNDAVNAFDDVMVVSRSAHNVISIKFAPVIGCDGLLPGPYADDVAAAAGGVPLYGFYLKPSGIEQRRS